MIKRLSWRYFVPGMAIILALAFLARPAAARQGTGAYGEDLHVMAQEKHALNSDTVGWLYIPGTTVDDVVLQNTEDRNQFYVRRDFNKNFSFNGSFFADYRCAFGETAADLSYNTTIYGNSDADDDPDGLMFSTIKRYRDADFLAENPYLYFATTAETYTWEVFAVSVMDIDVPYNRPDIDHDEFLAAVDKVREASIHGLGNIPVGKDDKILTLSTNDQSLDSDFINNYRFVVMAKLVDGPEAAASPAQEDSGTGESPPESGMDSPSPSELENPEMGGD